MVSAADKREVIAVVHGLTNRAQQASDPRDNVANAATRPARKTWVFRRPEVGIRHASPARAGRQDGRGGQIPIGGSG